MRDPRRDVFVSVVVPVRDSASWLEGQLATLISVLKGAFREFEVILVDDGSSAASIALERDVVQGARGVRLIVLSRSFGDDIAITAGLDSAIGDFVVTMLANDPPELIPGLVDRARAERGSLVGAVASDREGPANRLSDVMLRALSWAAGVKVPRGVRQFRVLSRQAVGALLESRDRERSLAVLTSQIGFGTAAFEYATLPLPELHRPKGPFHAAAVVIDLSVATGRRPLRLVSAVALAGSVANLAYAGYVVALYVVGVKVIEGWTTLSLELSAMFFLLFVLLAVIAEYLGHLLVESRDRPLYFVVDETSSPAPLDEETRPNLVVDPAGGGIPVGEGSNVGG
ncbi:MAG: glycosyltransferase [Chloroflexota bacterium]